MDGAVTREEAAARWRQELDNTEASSQRTWPGDITAGMSEFERLTLITEILMPVRNELALEFEEAHQRDQPSGNPLGTATAMEVGPATRRRTPKNSESTRSIRSSWPPPQPATGGSGRT